MPSAISRHDHAPAVTSHRGSTVWAGGGPAGLFAASAASADADIEEGVMSGPVDMRGSGLLQLMVSGGHVLSDLREQLHGGLVESGADKRFAGPV